MAKKLTTEQRRTAKVRRQLKKVANGRPRLSVYRSSQNIYAQVIDDTNSKTLAAVSSLKEKKAKGSKIDQAASMGKLIGEAAKAAGVVNVKFDRNGYLYHGRVKAFAEAAREAGLNF